MTTATAEHGSAVLRGQRVEPYVKYTSLPDYAGDLVGRLD
ncbi:MAG: hypothetical protein AVDCRST_MAG88-41 [uncultured Thermomicrobiales bacterium]|uniref:Uncharacterized protein n=1 Tax=uncultured Thermomicrobiales bacterium TaxID=1645740 RepID=A0A6J4U5Q8_9BACT|nr:MAG: hypothetical protein AVDCRST_MAG88-41 [uncultured Thermomicrobiales bacterium]